MDRLEVITETVTGAAERLSGVSTVLHRFTEALAGYGDHADALARASASAAQCYEAPDHL